MEPPQETTSPLPLQNRVAIVTGSSRGIGKEIAFHLSSLGAKLVINYSSLSSKPLAQDIVSQLNSSSSSSSQPRAVSFHADVSDPTQVGSLFDLAEQFFGTQPHIVVTSAGLLDAKFPSIVNTSLDDFDRIFAVNAKGTFLCIKEAAKRVKKGGGGRIVTVSSTLVAAFTPGYGAYTASKAAVEAMTKILAKELKGTRITVNCVAPGPIETEMFFEGKTGEMVQKIVDDIPLQRLGKVEDVAPLVGFLAGDSGEWVNGQIIKINGGYN